MTDSTRDDILKYAIVLLGAAAIFAYNIIHSVITRKSGRGSWRNM